MGLVLHRVYGLGRFRVWVISQLFLLRGLATISIAGKQFRILDLRSRPHLRPLVGYHGKIKVGIILPKRG